MSLLPGAPTEVDEAELCKCHRCGQQHRIGVTIMVGTPQSAESSKPVLCETTFSWMPFGEKARAYLLCVSCSEMLDVFMAGGGMSAPLDEDGTPPPHLAQRPTLVKLVVGRG